MKTKTQAQGQEEEIEEPAPAAEEPLEQQGEPPTTDDLEVDLSEDIDLGDGKKLPPAAPPDKTKKPNRFKLLKQENSELLRQLAELRGQVTGLGQQRQQQPQGEQQPDPLERRLEGLEDQRQGLLTQLSAQGLSKDDGDRLMRQYRKVEREIRETDVVMAARKMGLQPPQRQDPQAVERQILNSEFPQVFGDPYLRAAAEAEMTRLVTKLRKPMSLATAREAAQRVMRNEGLVRPPPNENDKRKLSSVSGSAGGAGGGGGQNFKPSRLQLNAARAYTAHLPDMRDKDRVKKWVKEVGKPSGLV